MAAAAQARAKQRASSSGVWRVIYVASVMAYQAARMRGYGGAA